jgi:hypothetical protein
MKSILRSLILMLSVGLLPISSQAAAVQEASKKATSDKPVEAKPLLEKGQASGSLPVGMTVRIGACLGAPEVKASKDREPDELREMWEFTADQVHRVVLEYKDDKPVYHRVESCRFDSKDICKDLLDGNAVEIQTRKGKGPEIALVGTSYQLGSRSIEVVWKGKAILYLHEGNAPALDCYRETDARAFGALYERLAGQARRLFKPTAGEAK